MSKTIAFFMALMFFVAGVMLVSFAMRQGDEPGDIQVVQTAVEWVTPDGADAPLLERYSLFKQDGKMFHSEELDGQVHLVSFFFSNCPYSCLDQNKQIKLIEDDFAEQGVKFLSITCDPSNDTPHRLASYSKMLEATDNWYFLTGDMEYLKRVGGEFYLVSLQEKSHSENLLIFDKWGNMRGKHNWKDASEIALLRRNLRTLLNETEPPPADQLPYPRPTPVVIPDEEDSDETQADETQADETKEDAGAGQGTTTQESSDEQDEPSSATQSADKSQE